ncbi:uncharacterized protein LOC110869693 [Helianthus annuus]|uniref:uncharacterized protein LOC110869693 n=1 Tax=Helianthus annuus TaxID=4232 RepID=UPI000B8F1009|nr:uncharacterized protein LOC110869693 [Helianthus annuus]
MSSWAWSRKPSDTAELAEWNILIDRLDLIQLSDNKDKWSWLGGDCSEFSVKTVKEFLNSGKDFSEKYVFSWSKWVPKKINIFIWRAILDRLPTLTSLKARNCYSGDLSCCMCEDGEESVTHLLCSCSIASRVWQHIEIWCKVNRFFAFSVKDLIEFPNFCGLRSKVKEALKDTGQKIGRLDGKTGVVLI